MVSIQINPLSTSTTSANARKEQDLDLFTYHIPPTQMTDVYFGNAYRSFHSFLTLPLYALV